MEHSAYLLLPVVLVVTAGCIFSGMNPPPAPAALTPAGTPVPSPAGTPVPSLTAAMPAATTLPDDGDRKFLDAVDLCYASTPVINDTRTGIEFTVCMQHTPVPSGWCAQRFRSEILTYATKDDETTAGYQRSTYNMKVARVRFGECRGGIG